MQDEQLLMIPGPVPLDESIRTAMSKPMISHRSQRFEAVYRECQAGLQDAFGTDGDVVFINGSGSAAMEVAVSNVVGWGDAVVCLQNGKFGERFERIARRYTDDVRPVASDWGEPLDLDGLRDALDDDVAAVTMVHADTSSGILNPVDAVGDMLEDHDAMLVVDAVTAAGCERLRVDDWGVDLAVTASQKALGAPPGVSALTVSDDAQTTMEPDGAPRYFDLSAHLDRSETHQTPTTSPVQVFWGLQVAVRRMMEEGIDARVERHARMSQAVREAGAAMGLRMHPTLDDRSAYTNAVTVLEVPDGIDAGTAVEEMADHGVLVRTGLGSLADRTIRIGTMGSTGPEEIRRTVDVLQTVLEDSAVGVDGDGVATAEAVLTEERYSERNRS